MNHFILLIEHVLLIVEAKLLLELKRLSVHRMVIPSGVWVLNGSPNINNLSVGIPEIHNVFVFPPCIILYLLQEGLIVFRGIYALFIIVV